MIAPGLARVETTVLRVPTDRPEADGTFSWDSTTVLLVEVADGTGRTGTGWSYASRAAAAIVQDVLRPAIADVPASDVGRAWDAMVRAVRNAGRAGVAATAISAVDVALWDLRARSLDLPLYRLLGVHRDSVPIYGSGGFTSYTLDELVEQLTGWVAEGIPRVKMKIGTGRGARPQLDRSRVLAVREAIGDDAELFVDANGAYTAKQAIRLARELDGVASYFEEPVSSDQLDQLALVRRAIGQDVAAGEYGYDPWYFRTMLTAEAVDVLQADATRCLGITGFLLAGAAACAHGIPFSAHTSPTIHAHAGCAVPQLSHVEYFHDHVRIERMLFEGSPRPEAGRLAPAPDRPGLGVEVKRPDVERYRLA